MVVKVVAGPTSRHMYVAVASEIGSERRVLARIVIRGWWTGRTPGGVGLQDGKVTCYSGQLRPT